MLGRKGSPLAARRAPCVALQDVLCAAGGRLCPVAVGMGTRAPEKLPAASVPAAHTGSFHNLSCFPYLYVK